MKRMLPTALMVVMAVSPIAAMTLKEYYGLTRAQQDTHLRTYVEQVIANVPAEYAPDTCKYIREFFFTLQQGKATSAGSDKLAAALAEVDQLVKKGELDLGVVTIENVVNKVVRDEFPAEIWVGKTPEERLRLRRERLARRLQELEKASKTALANADTKEQIAGDRVADLHDLAIKMRDGRAVYPDPQTRTYRVENTGATLTGRDITEASAKHAALDPFWTDFKAIENRALKLANGRIVYIADGGTYVDQRGRPLPPAEVAEATQKHQQTRTAATWAERQSAMRAIQQVNAR